MSKLTIEHTGNVNIGRVGDERIYQGKVQMLIKVRWDQYTGWKLTWKTVSTVKELNKE